MSATGLKAHRRTLSLSQPSEYIPPIDIKPPAPNTSSNDLSVPAEWVAPLTPPPTPSKEKARLKFYPRKKNRKKEDIQFSHDFFPLYDIKRVLFTIIFYIALIVFLASLAGIGPLDDDFHYAPKVKPLHTEGISDKLREDAENRRGFLDQKVTDHIELDEKEKEENNIESSLNNIELSFNQPNLDELVQQEEKDKAYDGYEREGESVVEVGDVQSHDELEKDHEYKEGLEHEKGYNEDHQEEPKDEDHNESNQELEYQDHNVGYQGYYDDDDDDDDDNIDDHIVSYRTPDGDLNRLDYNQIESYQEDQKSLYFDDEY